MCITYSYCTLKTNRLQQANVSRRCNVSLTSFIWIQTVVARLKMLANATRADYFKLIHMLRETGNCVCVVLDS